jgi:tRNA (cytidine32/uridine32-2'-O)-methyltransferase
VNIPARIVLVETSHPGNIGAAARAMKTMGLDDLALVNPKAFPSEEAMARASGADDLLERAHVAASLAEAIADCALVVGTSARLRSSRWPVVDPRTCAEMLWQRMPEQQVAIVLGPEQSGLTNDDMARCRLLVHIPTAPGFGSLNVAMAVQVICYELRMCRVGGDVATDEARAAPAATAAELEGLHGHLEDVLTRAGFLQADHPHEMKLKLRRLFQRAALDRNEVNILRGVLAALDPQRSRPPS